MPTSASTLHLARLARELLPCPLPYGAGGSADSASLQGMCRAVRARVRKTASVQEWADAGVATMNELFSRPPSEGRPLGHASAGQALALEAIKEAYSSMEAPPCTTAAASFRAMCGSPAGYAALPSAAAPLRRDSRVSLPPVDMVFADAEQLLSGEDLTAWVDWRRVLLRTPADLQEVRAFEGVPMPNVGPGLKRDPVAYARFLKQLLDRG